ncbi:multidrug efflux SMR transporter [Bacillus altitudinis MN12]|uniref:Multidrug efflux SMR transporter n=2 Tax=Bacillus TaxID=1386 RepID=A0AAU7FP32_9BACI|nr:MULTISPECIES: multidrug efflux SMR transporter [Bacillus]ANT56698.1 multidrug transporter [Bacillus pumilus]EMI13314.1 small multidrug efflux transporter [Bacillus stratosphericus LAMA 585]KQL39124.1 multidrug transporter [Bacillus sp. FJAT-21955]MBR3205475.1 multidrug efflux SMR transporter [Bacillus sp. (in: firmicutes)]NQW95374.1 multidrug efflux SMR transporter [Bacillus stratosphericus]UJM29306.1 multidrug efflux SMR transporter [Bacillus aerophilus]
MKGMLYLTGAILTEVFGSTMLKLSQGFTQVLPSMGVLIGFGCAFTFLSLALKTIELSSAYATWSGVGTALTALVGLVLFNETIHMKGFIGLALVICGVIVLNQSKKQKEEKKEPFDQTEWTS